VKVEKKEVHEEKDGVDTVKVVEVRTETVRKLKCVEERKNWELFGLDEENIATNDGMSESEEAVWEFPVVDKRAEKQAEKKELPAAVKCRFCGGSHFSAQCSQMAAKSEPAAEMRSGPAERPPASSSPAPSGKYDVRQRLGLGGPRPSSDRYQQEGFRVRVQNLTEDASEMDVRELFGTCGTVTRCFLKKKYGGGNTGFAYVTFQTEKEALTACERLNRHPYGSLLLSVEMQKDQK